MSIAAKWIAGCGLTLLLASQGWDTLAGMVRYARAWRLAARAQAPTLDQSIEVALGPHLEALVALRRSTRATDSILYVFSLEETLALGARLKPWYALLQPRRLAGILVASSEPPFLRQVQPAELRDLLDGPRRLDALVARGGGRLWVVDFHSGLPLDWQRWGHIAVEGTGFRIWQLHPRAGSRRP